nr:hypothetical protein Itr_chr14CG21360 [Ipomoea trifida]
MASRVKGAEGHRVPRGLTHGHNLDKHSQVLPGRVGNALGMIGKRE